jgi:hypothetical protein
MTKCWPRSAGENAQPLSPCSLYYYLTNLSSVSILVQFTSCSTYFPSSCCSSVHLIGQFFVACTSRVIWIDHALCCLSIKYYWLVYILFEHVKVLYLSENLCLFNLSYYATYIAVQLILTWKLSVLFNLFSIYCLNDVIFFFLLPVLIYDD